MTGANSFYRCNDIDLPNLNNRKQFSPKPLKKNSLWVEKTDIQAILEHAGVRDRAIILIMVSSGLAQSDVLALRVKDVKEGYDEATGITTLSVRRIKTEYDFTTFLSPEAGRAVLSWIELRNQKHEKFKIRSDDDFLFIKRDVPDSYLKTYDDRERLLDKYGLMAIFRRLSAVTGRETEKGTWSLVRAHNLRKYFNSTILNNGGDIFFVDYLMGHKIDQMHEAYYRADPVKLREKYMRYLPFLSIEDTEVKMIESPEYQELKAELEALKQERTERQPYDGIIDDLMDDNEFLALLQKKIRERGIG
jgi:integrase